MVLLLPILTLVNKKALRESWVIGTFTLQMVLLLSILMKYLIKKPYGRLKVLLFFSKYGCKRNLIKLSGMIKGIGERQNFDGCKCEWLCVRRLNSNENKNVNDGVTNLIIWQM